MGKLRWFTDTEYESLADVLGVIKKELEALQPQDSSDIRWNRGNDGMSAVILSSNVGAEQSAVDEVQTIETVTESGYNSYFKLVLITEVRNNSTRYKVAVVDGATYDSKTQSSGDMPCKVNNAVYHVKPYMSQYISGSTSFIIRYTAPEMSPEGVTGEAKAEIIEAESLPSDSYSNCYFLVGRAIYNSNTNSCSIIQDWKGCNQYGGTVPMMLWFTPCVVKDDESNEDDE